MKIEIIDTVLVRACGSEASLYDALALRVLGRESSLSKQADFACRRAMANWQARERYQHPVSLEDIYSVADFKAETAMPNADIMQQELQLEAEMLVGVESMRQRVKAARAKAGQIYFTSDSYLPASLFIEVLTREGFYEPGDKVVVRGEVEQSAEKPLRVHHKRTAYQKEIATLPDHNQLQRPSVLGSISRAVLLSNGNTPANLFAADIIAPTIVTVVYELMERAHKRGIKKLFFLARDAKLMYETAKVFHPLFPEIEIEYAYLSRTSLYFPSIPEVNATWLNYIYEATKDLGYSINDFVKKYLPGVQLQKEFADFEALCNDKESYELLRNYHTEQRTLMLEYFTRIGLASQTEEVGVVDYNTSGKTLDCINRILKQSMNKPCSGLFYVITANRIRCNEIANIDTVLHYERIDSLYMRVMALTNIFEDYCLLTNHGRTTHYNYNARGEVIPVYENEAEKIKQRNNYLFSLHTRICQQWAKLFMQSGTYTFNDYNITCTQWLLVKFGQNPRREYLQCLIGSTYDVAGMENAYIIKRLTVKDLFQIINTRDVEHGDYGWPRGSLVATFGLLGRLMINIAMYTKKLLKF
jgi:hypothetical protein